MKTNLLLMSTIAATIMLGEIVPQSARAEIPMQIMSDEGQWFLTVPEAETTASAYGGRLRLYDIHIAKMIEFTHFLCTSPRRASSSPEENGSLINSYDWIYRADRGTAEMGGFTITCKLAQSLANTYGLGEPETTTVWYEVSSATMGSTTKMIPILDIRREEIDEWMNFTASRWAAR
ncbi:MAG: hypothetical protein LH702_33585 [Phormidesmis sp. CAN_BIN44]|nr:hypothetical protein [Phormidesmis sp. CAN_BIN44]